MRQGSAIDKLQLTPNRYAMGDAGDVDRALLQLLGNIVCSRLTFYGRVGRQDQLTDLTPVDALEQLLQPELVRPDNRRSATDAP